MAIKNHVTPSEDVLCCSSGICSLKIFFFSLFGLQNYFWTRPR